MLVDVMPHYCASLFRLHSVLLLLFTVIYHTVYMKLLAQNRLVHTMPRTGGLLVFGIGLSWPLRLRNYCSTIWLGTLPDEHVHKCNMSYKSHGASILHFVCMSYCVYIYTHILIYNIARDVFLIHMYDYISIVSIWYWFDILYIVSIYIIYDFQASTNSF